MAEEPTVTVTPADASATPAAANNAEVEVAPVVVETEAKPSAPADKPKTVEELQAENARIAAALKTANKEAETRRKRLEEIDKAAQEKADAEKTELQKANDTLAKVQVERDERDAKLRRLTILDAARDEAERQGLAFNAGALTDAFELRAFESVEIGEDGKAQGVDAALKELVKARPYLVKDTKRTAPDLDAAAHGAGSLLDTPEAQRAKNNLLSGF